jgi:hypothetical protein
VDQQLLEAALLLPMRVLFTEASELMFGEPLHRPTALARITCNFNSFLACAGGEIAKATRALEAWPAAALMNRLLGQYLIWNQIQRRA